MIILDTNIVSALMRPEQNGRIVAWTDAQPQSALWTSTVSLLEIRSGLLFMPEGKRRRALEQGFAQLLDGLLGGKLLAFDQEAAEEAARVDLIQHRTGRSIGAGDIQIAGIARARRATLATRNVKDFANLDIPLIDPWAA